MPPSRNQVWNVLEYCQMHHSVEHPRAANSRPVKVHLSQSARAAISNNVRYNRTYGLSLLCRTSNQKGLTVLVSLCDAVPFKSADRLGR